MRYSFLYDLNAQARENAAWERYFEVQRLGVCEKHHYKKCKRCNYG